MCVCVSGFVDHELFVVLPALPCERQKRTMMRRTKGEEDKGEEN